MVPWIVTALPGDSVVEPIAKRGGTVEEGRGWVEWFMSTAVAGEEGSEYIVPLIVSSEPGDSV